ncbi:hypothetical protein [Kordia sp. SMS9]|uniref:hypothetical protein n=1 Tax=Kordia sp. SMS9 TaxID=2282170 RepID=UPI000E0D5B84|nr:hypothetical protein [Kordia sp. SMS9]
MYSVNAQTDLQQDILGKWKFVKATTDAEKNTSKQTETHLSKEQKDPLMQKDVLLRFESTKDIAFEVENILLHAEYGIKDSILTIGRHKYAVLKITKEALHLKSLNDSIPVNYELQRIVAPKKDKK